MSSHKQMGYGVRNANGKAEDELIKIKDGSTIHSLREDTEKLFKAGLSITLYSIPEQNVKKYGSTIKCTGYQSAVLRSDSINVSVTIDGRLLTGADMVQFYRNEGFNTLDDFLNWYIPLCARNPEKTIKRKLVHWTDFRY